MKESIWYLSIAWLLVLCAGCATAPTVRYGSADQVETVTTDFGSADLQMIAEKMVNALLATPLLQSGKQPVIYVHRVQNRTDEHIDTTSITDKIKVTLLKSGRVRFSAVGEEIGRASCRERVSRCV